MKAITTLAFLALTLCFFSTAQAAPVTFDWVTVDNPGNAGDVTNLGIRGAVDYTYRISKYEVTNAQYTEFLNAVDPTADNSLDLYFSGIPNFSFGMAGNFGGIEVTGTTDGARYVVQAGREQNPINFISFFDAMRFTNWLHNGQGSGGTESGVYTISLGWDEVRSANAKYWIPSEDEWYKAAYHNANAGLAATYFDFPTGTPTLYTYPNPAPVSNQPGDAPQAEANFFNNDFLPNSFNDGYAVSGSPDFPNDINPLTDVGAYTDSPSSYGTFDQAGNVWEWNDGNVTNTPTFRVNRGGGWASAFGSLRSGARVQVGPTLTNTRTGFRVATVESIPEPFLLGDYNDNGIVDAADYTVWLDALGGSILPNDSTSGIVDQSDYEVWKANFGATAAIIGMSTIDRVPEPCTALLGAMASIGLLMRGRRLS